MAVGQVRLTDQQGYFYQQEIERGRVIHHDRFGYQLETMVAFLASTISSTAKKESSNDS
jgi:hypothetical protein